MKDINDNNREVSPELLWEQFINGDMFAFRVIYTTHYKSLHQYGVKYLSHTETEDSIQSLFLYILQRRKKLAKVQNVKAYLLASLRNQITKIARAKQLIYMQLENDQIAENNASKEPVFEELLTILQKLSPRELEIVHLKYYQEYNSKEIASFLGLRNQTVRNTLRNALKKMRSYPQLSFG